MTSYQELIDYRNTAYEPGLIIYAAAGINTGPLFFSADSEIHAQQLQEVLSAIKTGRDVILDIPEPKILHSEDIENYYEELRLRKHQENEYPLLPEAMGLVIDLQTNGLRPLSRSEILTVSKQPTQTLLHTGLISQQAVEAEKEQPARLSPFDNLKNMRTFGVFGSHDPRHLVYVRPVDSMASGMSRKANVVRLEIDLNHFPETWPIYHNIEMWKDWGNVTRPPWANHDLPYASYTIPGGIPVKAITKIEIGHVEEYEG